MTRRKANPKFPGRRPDIKTQDIVSRYVAGESSLSIAAALGCCSRTVALRLAAAGIPMRPNGKIKTYKGLHPSYKGASVTYTQFHRRVSNQLGRPSECSRCGRTDAGVSYDWANLTGKYEDIADYARMCRSCHRRFDFARRRASKSYDGSDVEAQVRPAVAAYFDAIAEVQARLNAA